MITSIRDFMQAYPGLSPEEMLAHPELAYETKVKLGREMSVGSERDEGFANNLLVGMGRGFMDTGQGVKQAYLQATNPEAAAEYTATVNDELKRYRDDFAGTFGGENVGRLIGWAAPSVALGAGGLARTALAGAVEGAAQFDETNSNAGWATNAVLGGGLGAAGAGVGRLLSVPTPRTPEKENAVRFAAEEGVKLRPGDIADSASSRFLTNAADAALIGRSAENTLEEGRRVLGRRAGRYDEGDLGAAYDRGIENAKARETNAYNAAKQQLGEVQINIFDVQRTLNDVVRKAPYRERESLRKVVEDTLLDMTDGRTDLNSQFINLDDLLRARSNFGSSFQGHWTREGYRADTIDGLYSSLSNIMRRAAADKDVLGASMLNDAIEQTARRHDAQRTLRMWDGKDEDAIARVLYGDKTQKQDALRYIMSERGAETVRDFIYQDVMSRSAEEGGQRIFGAGSAAQRLTGYINAMNRFGDPDQIAELRGMRDYFNAIKANTATVANPPTGQRLLGPILSGIGITADPTGAIGATAMLSQAIQQIGLPALMRRRDMTALARKLSTLPDDSPLRDRIISSMSDIIRESAGPAVRGGVVRGMTEPTPLEIQIRDGVPQ